MPTQLGLEKIATLLDEKIIDHGEVRIDETDITKDLRRVIVDGNQVRAHIYLTQNDPAGTVSRARLIDKDGDIFEERTDELNHEAGKGLLIEFRYNIEEVSE